MDKELARLRDVLGGDEGTVGRNGIVARKCGIGKVNAALGTADMIIEHKPDVVVSTGVAGGAASWLNIGDVVVGDECRYHDVYCGSECRYGQVIGMPEAFTAPRELVDKALNLHAGTPVHAGLIVTGDCFVDSPAKMRDILSRFPQAAAVDMESCSIAQTCYIYNTPFISFRIISDIPLSDDNTSQYFDFWEHAADNSFDITKAFLASI